MGAAMHYAGVPVSTQLDPRVLPLSVEAEVLYYRSFLYAAEHTTNGVIPSAALHLLTMKLEHPAEELMEELRQAGLVAVKKGLDTIVDYLNCNPTAAQVKARSDHARKASLARWSGRASGEESSEHASGIPEGTSGEESSEDAGSNPPTDLSTYRQTELSGCIGGGDLTDDDGGGDRLSRDHESELSTFVAGFGAEP